MCPVLRRKPRTPRDCMPWRGKRCRRRALAGSRSRMGDPAQPQSPADTHTARRYRLHRSGSSGSRTRDCPDSRTCRCWTCRRIGTCSRRSTVERCSFGPRCRSHSRRGRGSEHSRRSAGGALRWRRPPSPPKSPGAKSPSPPGLSLVRRTSRRSGCPPGKHYANPLLPGAGLPRNGKSVEKAFRRPLGFLSTVDG
jgi:hypothetical protein